MHAILYRQLHVLPEGMVVPSACLPACLPASPPFSDCNRTEYVQLLQSNLHIHSFIICKSIHGLVLVLSANTPQCCRQF